MIKMIIIGNAVAEPKQFTTQSGKNVSNVTVAVNLRDKSNSTQYVEVSFWGKLGEIASQYINKGTKVMVSGRPSTRAYKNKNGDAAASLCLMADELELLSGKQDTERSEPQTKKNDGFTPVSNDEDLPY